MRALPDPPVLVITDRRQAAPRSLDWVVAAALEGGIRWISVREKDLEPDDRRALLRRLRSLASAVGAVLMVHDDLDAARRLGLQGLHLPRGADAAAARAILPGVLIGQSWHTPDLVGAPVSNVDYLTLSPIYPTPSKPDYGPALGLAGLAVACGQRRTTILALGGIDVATLPACLGAGAGGVAVMGGIMRARDPAETCAALLASFRR